MKRLHVNVGVADLQESVRFYSSLFDAEPTVIKDDYAKWMLDDPRVNFSITSRGRKKGIDHLGIQVETVTELQAVYARLKAAEAPLIDQGAVTCCYAKSQKNWSYDPEGIAWETFLTTGESATYGSDRHTGDPDACCNGPEADPASAPAPCCAGEIRADSLA